MGGYWGNKYWASGYWHEGYWYLTQNANSYVGDISLYLDTSCVSTYKHHYSYTGSISLYLDSASPTKGRHQWFYDGDISLYPKINSPTFNHIGIPPPSGEYTGTLDVIVPFDAVDLGLQATGGGIGGPGMTVDEFFRSMFILDTANYNGECTFFHQIIARNISPDDYSITLKRLTSYAWNGNTFDVTTEDIDAITIPGGTTAWTYFSAPFTPVTGEHRYYWKVPFVGGPYSQVALATGRYIVKQLGASNTLIWRPMFDSGEGGLQHAHVGMAWSSPRLWGYYGPEDWQSVGGTWYWDPSLYLANLVTIVMECCAMSSWQAAWTDFRLYDLTADAPVTGTDLRIYHGGTANYPPAYVDRLEFNSGLLVAGHLYTSQFRLYGVNGGILSWILTSCGYARASFGIKLTGMFKCEVVWRLSKACGNVLYESRGSSRAKIELPGGNTELDYAKNETCSMPDFDFSPSIDQDFWITNDGHVMSGDGSAAVNVSGSNANQQETPLTLTPHFSGDFSENLVSGDMYCSRQIPNEAGSDAIAQWILLCLGYKTRFLPTPDEEEELGCPPIADITEDVPEGRLSCAECEEGEVSCWPQATLTNIGPIATIDCTDCVP